MDLSIIIVNYNVKEFLQNLIYSIEKASSDLNIEIIVVDNASSDGSVELIEEKFPSIKLIANEKNLGFSAANNAGLKIAKGKFLLLLNPDTLVQEDTFKNLIEFFQKSPDAGLVGCKILNPDGTLQLACRRGFPGPWTSFCKVTGLSTLFPNSKLFARYNLTYLDENQTYEVDAISGSFMMFTREVYEKVGGLDEQFFMYGEDLDICYRVQKAGYKNYYVHSTQIIHYKGESTKRSGLDETKIFYNAMHLFVKKHLASSFLVEIILRIAIFFRELIAFAGKRKLILISVILDFLFFNITLFAAAHLYSLFKLWQGFNPSAFPIIYTIPALVHILSAAFSGVYNRENLSVSRNLISIIISFFIVSSLTFFFKDYAYSRAVILLTYLFLFISLSGWRIFFKLIFKLGLSGNDITKTKALIIGTGNASINIAKKIKNQINGYNNVIGFIGLSAKDFGKEIEGIPVVGSLENIRKVIAEKKINQIIFSSEELSYQQMMSIVSNCQKDNVEFKLAGNNLDFLVGKSSVSLLDDIPLFDLNYNITILSHRIIKKFFDLSISLTVLILVYPFLFLVRIIGKEASPLTNFLLQFHKIIFNGISIIGPKDPMNYENTFSEKNIFLGEKGLTGLWFTESSAGKEVEKLDIYYAKNQNIWLDIDILTKTFIILKNKR